MTGAGKFRYAALFFQRTLVSKVRRESWVKQGVPVTPVFGVQAQQRRVSQFIGSGDRSLLLIFFCCSCTSYVYFQVTTEANTRICWRASWYDMLSHIVHSEHKLRTSSLQPVVSVRCLARKIRDRVNP